MAEHGRGDHGHEPGDDRGQAVHPAEVHEIDGPLLGEAADGKVAEAAEGGGRVHPGGPLHEEEVASGRVPQELGQTLVGDEGAVARAALVGLGHDGAPHDAEPARRWRGHAVVGDGDHPSLDLVADMEAEAPQRPRAQHDLVGTEGGPSVHDGGVDAALERLHGEGEDASPVDVEGGDGASVHSRHLVADLVEGPGGHVVLVGPVAVAELHVPRPPVEARRVEQVTEAGGEGDGRGHGRDAEAGGQERAGHGHGRAPPPAFQGQADAGDRRGRKSVAGEQFGAAGGALLGPGR